MDDFFNTTHLKGMTDRGLLGSLLEESDNQIYLEEVNRRLELAQEKRVNYLEELESKLEPISSMSSPEKKLTALNELQKEYSPRIVDINMKVSIYEIGIRFVGKEELDNKTDLMQDRVIDLLKQYRSEIDADLNDGKK